MMKAGFGSLSDIGGFCFIFLETRHYLQCLPHIAPDEHQLVSFYV
jgi:hypothetical protein